MTYPKSCPYLKTCTKKVDRDTAEFICATGNWIHCNWAKKKAEEYKKTPNEWLKELDIL